MVFNQSFLQKNRGGVIPKIEDFICDFGDFISKVQNINNDFDLTILLYIYYKMTPPPIFYKKGLEKNQDQVPLYLKIISKSKSISYKDIIDNSALRLITSL